MTLFTIIGINLLAVSLGLNIRLFLSLKKAKKSKLTKDATQLISDLVQGDALVRIVPIDQTSILEWRRDA